MLLSERLVDNASNPMFVPNAFFPHREQKYIFIYSDWSVSLSVLDFTIVYRSTSLL